ncbi:MAG: P83/100 family protein [Treponemataceae bacterium]|nr:MAG: P83/100 family protein [Treponemataceae bacterium]
MNHRQTETKKTNGKALKHSLALAFGALAFFSGSGNFGNQQALFAAEVNRPEIESVSGDGVVFENYSGPHSVIESIEQILGIGRGLGRTIATRIERSGTAGFAARYQVIHAIDNANPTGLDADILILGRDAQVDHITNLRRIIAGYLESAYSYNAQDAMTIATFVTVYNAVYRSNLTDLGAKYKSVVMENLTADSAGLSMRYLDWPGRTQIIIPVFDIAGGLSAIDTSVISDQSVIASMRGEEGKLIEDRKGLVDIKEREAENAEAKAAVLEQQAVAQQAAADSAQEKAQAAAANLDEKKEEFIDLQEAANAARAAADANPRDRAAQAEARQAEAAATAAEKELAQAQKEADSAEAAADAAQAQADATQAASDAQTQLAEQKLDEAQEERKNISTDQTAVLAASGQAENAIGVFGLKINSSGLSTIIKLNAANSSVMQVSAINVIRDRVMFQSGSNFIAIAGTQGANKAIKLVSIDSQSLEITGESTELIHESSILASDGTAYYAVVNANKKWVLGKFGADLRLTLKSEIEVEPSTPVIFSPNGIIVTKKNGALVILSSGNLGEVK